MTDQTPVFTIEKIYVKDLSVEVPGAPAVFLKPETPKVEVQIAQAVQIPQEGLYEVTLTITVTASAEERTLFLAEAAQAALFQIRNIAQSDMGPVLGILCPNVLFPYARETISDVITRAGFPPVLLAPMNFEALYQQRLAEEQAAAAKPPH
ncbi:MAG: protein-export chaperone SecB [Burkholderiales bacterium]|nr:protein-export chaperone SecB [Burkholderiales bacterium]